MIADSALQDGGDHDRRGFLAQDRLRLLPRARTDAQGGPHDARGCNEVSPVRNPASGIVDDVGTGVEDHAERKDGFPCPLDLGMKDDGFAGPASFGSRFKINTGSDTKVHFMPLSCERTGNIAFAGSIHRVPPSASGFWSAVFLKIWQSSCFISALE